MIMEPSVLSLLPPMVAIILAVWWRNVLPALFAGIWTGATLLENGRPDLGLLRLIDTHLLEQLASFSDDGSIDYSHLTIILFTLFLGAMIGVMSASGGSAAVVNRIAQIIKNRQQGQTLTWLTGLVVFFDDYANTILIGSTMRPVTDRLKISREKLAFLIDATAAPVAGLAVISTWAGFEVGLIEEGFSGIGQEVDGWQLFVETIPYRFYPVTMLIFVAAISWTGRDYGPMHEAETDAVNAQDEEQSPVSDTSKTETQLMRHAIIPLVVLLVTVAVGISNDMNNSSSVLLVASFLASIVAVFSSVSTRTLSIQQAADAWIDGIKSMIPACVILVMAWMIGAVCDETHLNTAGFLVSTIGETINPAWLPGIAFLMAAGVSFATGSSWATMTLLIPVFTSMSWKLLGSDTGGVHDPVLLGTIGSVLAGAIFGDHCSPISDTTVLSSAASQCDHIKHVSTQFPYALTVGGTSLFLGCLPIGYGMNVWICLAIQIATLIAVILFFGRHPGAKQKQLMPNVRRNPVVVIEASE
jgi:Na+/H+ antiporter NhaC